MMRGDLQPTAVGLEMAIMMRFLGCFRDRLLRGGADSCGSGLLLPGLSGAGFSVQHTRSHPIKLSTRGYERVSTGLYDTRHMVFV